MRIRQILLTAPLSLLAFAGAAAQQHEHAPAKDKPAGHMKEHMSGWKELDAYHLVMMDVWHPAKEKNDLAPVRASATKLADASDTLAKAAIPAACDSPESRAAVAQIQVDSRGLAKLVASATDAEVKESLKALHDRFETLNRGCKAGHH